MLKYNTSQLCVFVILEFYLTFVYISIYVTILKKI